MSEERRQHPRYELEVRVHLAQLGEVTGALTRDISAGGLFIATETALPLESCVPLRLIDPRTGEQIPTICEVVRQVRDADGQLTGLGLRFVHQDAALTERLTALVTPVLPQAVPAAALPADPTWEELQAEVPLDAVAVPTLALIPDQLEPRLLLLLATVDGQLTAEEIAAQASVSPADALAGLIQLRNHGLIEISLSLDDAILEVITPVLDTVQEQARAAHVDERVHLFREEAAHASAAGRFAEAVHLYEQALVLDPNGAAEIHARLAELALGPLCNARLAQLHAQALCERFPSDARGAALLARAQALAGPRDRER